MKRHDDPNAANLIKAQWDTIRGQLLLRSGARCETCGGVLGSLGWSAHHRDARGSGGTRRAGINALSNLLVACGSGSTGCHGWVHAHPTEATRLGWMLPTATDVLTASSAAPTTLFSGRRVLLDPLAPGYLSAPGAPYDLGSHPFRVST